MVEYVHSADAPHDGDHYRRSGVDGEQCAAMRHVRRPVEKGHFDVPRHHTQVWKYGECLSPGDPAPYLVHHVRRSAFDHVYAIAVLHMLVPDTDRAAFYRFIREHLEPGGLALIGSMGDGEHERQSDIRRAFELQERESGAGVLRVPSTSCRIVGFPTLERELADNGLQPVERGLCSMEPQFDQMMTVVVRQA